MRSCIIRRVMGSGRIHGHLLAFRWPRSRGDLLVRVDRLDGRGWRGSKGGRVFEASCPQRSRCNGTRRLTGRVRVVWSRPLFLEETEARHWKTVRSGAQQSAAVKPGEWARGIGGGRYGVPMRCGGGSRRPGRGRNRLSRANAGGRGGQGPRGYRKSLEPF